MSSEKLRRTTRVVLALGVALLVEAGGSAARAAVNYTTTGTYLHVGQSSQSNVYGYLADATCVSDCARSPARAQILLLLSGEAWFPNDPIRPGGCFAKVTTGGMNFHPGDPINPGDPDHPGDPVFPPSTATLRGESRGTQFLRVAGIVTSGTFAGRRVSGLVSYPTDPTRPGFTDPCRNGTVSGRLEFAAQPATSP